MSRSLGSTSLTTFEPMEIAPAEISSRPAIMRRRVDLPQPEGPTSTQNSPSSTATSTPCSTSVEPKLLRHVFQGDRSHGEDFRGRGQVSRAEFAGQGRIERVLSCARECDEKDTDHRCGGRRGRPPAPRARRALRPAALRYPPGRGPFPEEEFIRGDCANLRDMLRVTQGVEPSCTSAGSRWKDRGTPSCAPTSSAPTTCSRRRTRNGVRRNGVRDQHHAVGF